MLLEQENILIVDDDVHILELIQRHLQSLNYDTYKAVSVKEAISILQDRTIDLLITDLQMPGVDGLQLVKYVSEHFPKIPKLAVTGYPSIDGALNAMRSGVMDYLIKPFTKEELKNAVQKSLASRQKPPQETKKIVTQKIPVYSELIGESEGMLNVMNVIDRVKDTYRNHLNNVRECEDFECDHFYAQLHDQVFEKYVNRVAQYRSIKDKVYQKLLV